MGSFRFCNHMIPSVCKNMYGFKSLSKPSHMLIISTTLPSVHISAVSKNFFKLRYDFSKPYMLMSSKTLSSVKISHVSENLSGLGNAHRLHNPLCHFGGARNYSVYRTLSYICQPLLKCLSCVTFFTGRFETVPYINKTLYVFPFIDKIWGEIYFRSIKEALEVGLVVPQNHPQCVKIESIARKILKALQRETGGRHMLADYQWLKEDEEGVRLVKKKRSKENVTTANLMEGIDWELFVWDTPQISAGYINIGKIILWRGMFGRYEDAELATVIATMVGHVVARHAQRRLAWFPFKLYHRVVDSYDPELCYKLSQDHEADHIGMLLCASAGYHPHITVKAMKKAKEDCKNGGGGELELFFVDKRIEFLADPRVMQKALTIYEEKMKKGHVVD